MVKKVPLILSVITLLSDLILKFWVKTRILENTPLELFRYLTIHNREVIYTPVIYRIITIVAVILTIVLIFNSNMFIVLPTGPLLFIICGIVGNSVYNLKMIETFDNIPLFNIADCCVVIPTIIMLILLLSNKKRTMISKK